MPSSTESNRAPGRLARAALFACALLLVGGTAHAQNAPSAQSFVVQRSNPDAVIRFQGLRLADAHTDPAKNEIILDFDRAPDPRVFDRLEQALPDWVDTARTGDRSAVIRATGPVTFMTARERGGFALRMVAQNRASRNDGYLRGQIGGSGGRVALNGPPPGPPALRGPEYGFRRNEAVVVMMDEQPISLTQGIDSGAPDPQLGGFLTLSGQWRQPHRAHIYEGELAGGLPLVDHQKLLFGVHDSDVVDYAVRRLDGTTSAFRKNVLSAALGFGYEVGGAAGPGEIRGQALWGKNGWGGLLAYAERDGSNNWGASAEYHAPLNDTAEEVADHAELTRAQIGIAHRLIDNLWGQAVARVTRYGVKGDNAVARTAGATASLRYAVNLGRVWAGIGYEFNGEYVYGHHDYALLGGGLFTPLGIRNIEVHAMSGSLSAELWRGLWADTYGGYAINRYGRNGYFGGGDLRLALARGWMLTLSGGHTEVSTREGEVGPVTTANLKLIYNWDPGPQTRPSSSAFGGGWL